MNIKLPSKKFVAVLSSFIFAIVYMVVVVNSVVVSDEPISGPISGPIPGTPTPTVKPMPTVMPTVTPTPTVKPTLTPTPTPTPVNRPPVISPLTNWFKSAWINVPYKVVVLASDPDRDAISMKITGLPRGFTYYCQQNGKGRTMCTISGTPRLLGNYLVTVRATDARGARTIKTYTLSVIVRPVR